MFRKILSVLLSVVLLTACLCPVLSSASSTDGFGDYENVFIIGVDGVGAAFQEVDTPGFDRIFGSRAYRYDAKTEYVTISAQNWGSILTGVAYDVHGLTNDYCSVNPRYGTDENNSIFFYARQKFPQAELASFNNWNAINTGIIESDINVSKFHAYSDELVTECIVEYIEDGNKPKLMFVQLDEADAAAHSYGGFSEQYYDSVRRADTYIATIYDTLVKYGLMEKGLFIVVSDHGETYNGHGGTTREESSAVVAVTGKSVNNVVLGDTVRNRDVAAIALYALGVEKPEHMTASVPDGLFGEWQEDSSFDSNDLCAYCGKIHEGFFSFFIIFIHKILAWFM